MEGMPFRELKEGITIGAPASRQALYVIAADTERDYYMTAEEAKEYGLIDNVITNR